MDSLIFHPDSPDPFVNVGHMLQYFTPIRLQIKFNNTFPNFKPWEIFYSEVEVLILRSYLRSVEFTSYYLRTKQDDQL